MDKTTELSTTHENWYLYQELQILIIISFCHTLYQIQYSQHLVCIHYFSLDPPLELPVVSTVPCILVQHFKEQYCFASHSQTRFKVYSNASLRT